MERPSRYPEEDFLLGSKKNSEIDINLWVDYVFRRPDGLPDAVINKVEHCISFGKSQHESLTVYLMHPLYDDRSAVLFIKPYILRKSFLARVFSTNVTTPSSLVATRSPFQISIQPPPVQSSTPLSHNGLSKTMVLRTMHFEQESLHDARLAALINTQLKPQSGAEDSGHETKAALIGSVFDSLKDTVGCHIIEGERPQRHRRWWPYRPPSGKASALSHEEEGAEGAEGEEGEEGEEGTEGAEGAEGAEGTEGADGSKGEE